MCIILSLLAAAMVHLALMALASVVRFSEWRQLSHINAVHGYRGAWHIQFLPDSLNGWVRQ